MSGCRRAAPLRQPPGQRIADGLDERYQDQQDDDRHDRHIRLEALKAVPAEKVAIQLSSSISPCIIVPADESNSFLYMILPVRLKANEG